MGTMKVIVESSDPFPFLIRAMSSPTTLVETNKARWYRLQYPFWRTLILAYFHLGSNKTLANKLNRTQNQL